MNNRLTELCGKKIGIYTGVGTSHSWLWFVDVLEGIGLDNLFFIDEGVLKKEGELNKVDALLLSGGDTFAIAEGMGEKGARNLKKFILKGGIYFGSCAGAYLPLHSSKYPLNLLNLAKVKISNLSKVRPSSLSLSEKFCTPYGCHYVFHPVRDEVKIRIADGYSFRDVIKAPLYGGPCMEPSEDVTPIAFYHGFNENTLFLIDEHEAEITVVGKMAVCSKAVGKGKLYLSGPHLEHPHYPEANELLMEMLYDGLKDKKVFFSDDEKTGESEDNLDLLKELKRELSGARIIALSIERESMTWLIGRKVYEPEKFRAFIDALWKRIGLLERNAKRSVSRDVFQELIAIAREMREKLKTLKTEMHSSSDTTSLVEEIINGLRSLASSCMNLYFRLKRRENRWEEKTNVHVL
jgi:glutamine amidotransferase-like uncharacterized protein